MALTRLGFLVVKPGTWGLRTISVAGNHYVVKRGTARAMKWLISELNKIEPISEPGWDGTYNYRPVRGASVWSEHAAGTAYDHNASQHPMGVDRYHGFSTDQVRAIRKMLATPQGKCFRWGADYSGRKDPMHFEMRGPGVWALRKKYFKSVKL